MSPTLSICIPTRNRVDWLRNCIDVCLGQIDTQDLWGRVGIVVSNNASEDGTRAYLDSLIGTPGLVIHHNAENNGLINFETVCEYATSDYCWLMGDDDEPMPGMMARVLHQLGDGPDWIFGNLMIEHSDKSRDPCIVYAGGATWDISEESHFVDWANHLSSMAGAGGLLSNLIGRRELLLYGFRATAGWGVETGFPHVAAFLRSSALDGRVSAIRDPLVLFRDYNDPVGKVDPWERIMVDLRAWVKMSEMVLDTRPRMTDIERAAWYGILRRHHGLRMIPTLGLLRDNGRHKWEEAETLLRQVGYSEDAIGVGSFLPKMIEGDW